MTKKITRATFKKFIRDNKGRMLIRVESDFNGMSDCVEYDADALFSEAEHLPAGSQANMMGIRGVWLVGSSRDCFYAYEDDSRAGIRVSNACGTFVLAAPKPDQFVAKR